LTWLLYVFTFIELEEVLTLFKNFVKRNRPSLDIDAVATGETWFGEDALSTGLCDELRTVDDVLIEYIDCGYDVYQVRYDPPQVENGLNRLLPVGASRSSRSRRLSSSNTNNTKSGFLATMVRGFISMVKEEIMIELDGSNALDRNDDLKRRYMVHDSHVSQNVRSEI
jgi:ClpP class serine protease